MIELLISALDRAGRRIDSGLLTGENAEQPAVFRCVWQAAYPECVIVIEPAQDARSDA